MFTIPFMKKHLWIPLIAILLLLSADGYGQRWKLRRYEADLYISAVSFHGDIGLAHKPLLNNFNGLRPNVGLKTGFKIMQDLTVSLDLGYIMYGGKDEPGSSHGRNYSFTSQAFQHTVRMEYYIIGDSRSFISGAIYNRRGMINNYKKLYLYVFAGGGGVLSKSKVKDLNNGGEEPLANPGYDNSMNYAFILPLGGGIKFALNPRWSIGAEIGYQFTNSDLLDGYSKEGLSMYNDSYYLTCIKAIYRIRNNRQGVPVFTRYYR